MEGLLNQEAKYILFPSMSAVPDTLSPPCSVVAPVTPSVFRFAVLELRRLIEPEPEIRVPMVAVPDTLRLLPERL